MVGVKLEGSSEPGTELHLLNIGRGLVTAVQVFIFRLADRLLGCHLGGTRVLRQSAAKPSSFRVADYPRSNRKINAGPSGRINPAAATSHRRAFPINLKRPPTVQLARDSPESGENQSQKWWTKTASERCAG